MGYANFYGGRSNCLFSVKVSDEKTAKHLADTLESTDEQIKDWSYTETPVSRRVKDLNC
jgi:hypothetical protein